MRKSIFGSAALFLVCWFGTIAAFWACSSASDPARDARVARQAFEAACAFVPATAGREAQDVCAAVRGTCEGAGGSP